jgi:hypothetical protein
VLKHNPRFVAWAKAHGHTPETVLEHIPLYEFPIWNRGKLAEYSKINPLAFTCGGLTDHAAYDAWLEGPDQN